MTLLGHRRFETKGVKIIALLVHNYNGWILSWAPLFSVERIINEEKIVAVKVATYAVAKRKPENGTLAFTQR